MESGWEGPRPRPPVLTLPGGSTPHDKHDNRDKPERPRMSVVFVVFVVGVMVGWRK